MHDGDEQLERQLEERVSARTEELSMLYSHLLRKTEMERSVLAKELHDELGGLITAAKMDMSWLSSRLGGALDTESRDKIDSVMQMLNQAMMLKRRVVENLRPSLLDHFGLAVALRSHFDEHCARAGIECVATLPEEALELDALAQLNLFRVAQEALSVAIARGGVKNIEVVIEAAQDGREGYLMTIGDDGAPMETNLAKSMPAVRHRVQGVGGSVAAEARAEGNQLRVYVPRSAAGSA